MSAHTERSDMDHTVLPENYIMPVFCFASVHQMAPPLTEVERIWLELTAHLSTPKGRKAELAWLVYPHKWSPVSYRSSAAQGSSPAKRPTFYHCATQRVLFSLTV